MCLQAILGSSVAPVTCSSPCRVLLLALGEQDEFEDVMKTAEKAIREFINGEPSSYKIYEMEHPDVLLWAVWALQRYAKGDFA